MFKTILSDQTMSVENLIVASMKRFGLEKENKENFRIMIAIEEQVITPDGNDLIMDILSKYNTYFSQGTGKIQLSRRIKRVLNSDTSASIINQKRMSNTVILLSSSKPNLNSQEFSESINSFYESIIKSDNNDSFRETTDNISSFDRMYKEITNFHPVSTKVRSKAEYEQAKDLLNHNFITDVNENMELVRALKDNLEALVLISIKLYP